MFKNLQKFSEIPLKQECFLYNEWAQTVFEGRMTVAGIGKKYEQCVCTDYGHC
jgi:hypothetical protein